MALDKGLSAKAEHSRAWKLSRAAATPSTREKNSSP